MGNSYTTTDLVNNIILLAHAPIGQLTFSDDQLLQLATFEMQNILMKQILSTRGGYYLNFQLQNSNSTGLYPIPSQAIAGGLANVELLQNTTVIQVNLINESEQYSTNSPTSTSYGFYMVGNYVQILPVPNQGSPRLWFFRRPSALVDVADCAQITAISGNVLTVSATPDTFTSGTIVDVVSAQPPFSIWFDGEVMSTVSGTTLTMTDQMVGVQVGDYVCLNNQTCVPQIPVEFDILLVQRVVCKIYEIQNYKDRLDKARETLKEYENATMSLITTRVQSQTKIINPINGGFLGSLNKVNIFPPGKNI